MATRDKLEDSGGSAASTGLSESGARGSIVPPRFRQIIQPYLNQWIGKLWPLHYKWPPGFLDLPTALKQESVARSLLGLHIWPHAQGSKSYSSKGSEKRVWPAIPSTMG